MEIVSSIKERLKGTIVILGMGNMIKGDDGAGPHLIERLRVKNLRPKNQKLFLLDVGEVPENYLEKIVQYRPHTILLVDAVNFGGEPGAIRIFEPSDVEDVKVSTHCSSLALIIKYLENQTNSDIFFIGIQPKELRIGVKLSDEVSLALEEIANFLQSLYLK